MTKVTVLVSVYHAEQWLQQCLDSLVSQTLTDIQVVCVDDASTDGSLAILNDYALRDSRFEVIRLATNGGQAHARNVALMHAKGEYTCFLDADDWLAPDALQLMVEAFDEQTDCVLLDLVRCHEAHEEHYPMPSFDRLSGKEAFQLSLTWQIHGVYGVRTSLHQRYPYDESCRSFSDDNTTRIHYLCSRQVRCCRGTYYYRQHAASVTHQVSVRRFDYLRANESMRRQLLEQHVDEESIAVYENHRWLNLVDVYMFYHVHGPQLTGEERQYGLQELHRVWSAIDRKALNKKTIAKFGYRPCRWWCLFRLQEWLYFSLRGLLGKNY